MQIETCVCVDGRIVIDAASPGGNFSLQFVVSPPPKTGEIEGFAVYSRTAKGKIEYFALSATSYYVGSLNVTTQTDSDELASVSNYLVRLTCENPIPSTANLSIEFQEFNLEKLQVSGIYGLKFYVAYETYPDSIEIYESFTRFIESNTEILLLLLNLNNPSSSNTAGLQITIKSSQDSVICSGESKINISPHYLNCTLSLQNTEISQESIYSFKIYSEYLTNDSFITIDFPESISIENVKNLTEFEFSVQSQLILITSYIVFDSYIEIILDSIKNPNSTAETSGFVIILYESIQNPVKISQNLEVSIKPSPGSVSCQLTTKSSQVNDLTDYTFQVILSHQVSSQGTLVVLFPDEVKITSATKCLDLVNLPSGTQCKFSSSQVLIQNLFLSSFNYNFQFTLSSILNPASTCESAPFILRSYEGNLIIDENNSDLTVKMTVPASLSVSGTLSSTTVGEISYFSLITSTSIGFASKLEISFPSGFNLLSSFCESKSPGIKSLSCESTSTSTISLSFELLSEKWKTIEFSIQDIQNPAMTTKPDQVLIRSMTGDCTIDSGFSLLSITSPSSLAVTWSRSSSLISTPSNYSFSLKYSNPVPHSGYLLISLPASLQITESTFCLPSCQLLDSSLTTTASNLIQIFNLINNDDSSSLLSLELSTHFESSIIDSYKTREFYSTCLDNCLQCVESPSLCIKCSSSMFLFNSQCLVECPTGFGFINSTCVKCSDECENCLDDSKYCSKCFHGLAYRGDCVSTCPGNFTVEVNATWCHDCIENCLMCGDRVELCTACREGEFLYEEQCFGNCPGGLVGVDGVCEDCPCSLEMLNNSVCDPECNIHACKYDNYACESSLSLKSMPSVTAAAGTTFLTAGNKVIGKGEMLGPTLAIWALTQSCSWISFASRLSLSSSSSSSSSRMLSSSSRKLSSTLSPNQIFPLFTSLILLNFLLNLSFTLIYFFKFARSDILHYSWMLKHKTFTILIGSLSMIFSFQLIRLTYTGPNCLKCCKSPFFRVSTISVILMVYTVTYSILILAPGITLLVYILFTYSVSHSIYAATVDCLVLTIMIALTTLFDLVKLSIQIGLEQERPSTASVVPSSSKEGRPEETFEANKTEGLDTERKLRDTRMTEFFEPEDEDYDEVLKIGTLLQGLDVPTRWEVLNLDEEFEIAEVRDKQSGGLYAVKVTAKDETCIKAGKVIDHQGKPGKPGKPGKWLIGRTLDEHSLADVQVFDGKKDLVLATHVATGYKLLLFKSFVGCYLNDFATGTALYTTLSQEQEDLLRLEEADPSYASLSVDHQVLRVFRSFDGSYLVDVLSDLPALCEVSFSQEGRYDSQNEILPDLKP